MKKHLREPFMFGPASRGSARQSVVASHTTSNGPYVRKQQPLGNPEALIVMKGAPAVEGAGCRPPPGGPPIEIGEELLFGKVLPPCP